MTQHHFVLDPPAGVRRCLDCLATEGTPAGLAPCAPGFAPRTARVAYPHPKELGKRFASATEVLAYVVDLSD